MRITQPTPKKTCRSLTATCWAAAPSASTYMLQLPSVNSRQLRGGNGSFSGLSHAPGAVYDRIHFQSAEKKQTWQKKDSEERKCAQRDRRLVTGRQ